MQDIKKAKKGAWRFYKLWRERVKGKVYCKALKTHVNITSVGWNHIAGNKNTSRATKRPPADLLHRFELLRHAQEIIETGEKAGERTTDGKDYTYLDKTYQHKTYRIVLGKVEQDKYFFISIIDVT